MKRRTAQRLTSPLLVPTTITIYAARQSGPGPVSRELAMLLGNHDEGVNRTPTLNIASIPAVELVQMAQTHSTPNTNNSAKRLLRA